MAHAPSPQPQLRQRRGCRRTRSRTSERHVFRTGRLVDEPIRRTERKTARPRMQQPAQRAHPA
eukprot:8595097-Alexandrium_andersonii.AAC.1